MTANKPCPFCGGDKLKAMVGQTYRWCFVWCGECDAHGPEVRRASTDHHSAPLSDDSIALAFAAWNERVTPST